jgi:hypothetical protein
VIFLEGVSSPFEVLKPISRFGAVNLQFSGNTSPAFRFKAPTPNNSVGVGRLYTTIRAILDHPSFKQKNT